MAEYIVVMGARVLTGGRPSGALARRIRAAAALGEGHPGALFVATGGVGEVPPSEAVVIRRGLAGAGVSAERVILEEAATDTLSSVLHCARLLRERGDAGRVLICTDRFHVARCVLLFRILGLPARGTWIEGGLRRMGIRSWLYYWTRDLIAMAWDLPQAIWHRSRIDA